MVRRLIVPPELLVAGQADLPDDLVHYVSRVLRLSAQSQVCLMDGAGGMAQAELLSVHKSGVRVQVGAVQRAARQGPQIELLQAVAKGDKMDQVMRQATELGVGIVRPVLSDRAVARQDKKLERWRGIAEDALRVTGRRWRPHIEPVQPLSQALSQTDAELRLVLALDRAHSLRARLDEVRAPCSVALLIGPEGGLTEPEVAQAEAAGFLAVHMGPHTLRTETAGPAAAAIISFWAGGLGGAA